MLSVFFFGFTSVSNAQINCNNWVCEPPVCNPITSGCSSFCYCDDGVNFGFNCGSGFYTCNNCCCAVGSGAPPSGGGGSIPCRPVAVNCPAGSAVDYTQEVSSSCWNIQDQGSACGIGNAQLQGDNTSTGTWCCYGRNFDSDNCWVTPRGVTRCEQYWECRNPAIKTYNCVATTPTCTVDVVPQTISAGTSTLFPVSHWQHRVSVPQGYNVLRCEQTA